MGFPTFLADRVCLSKVARLPTSLMKAMKGWWKDGPLAEHLITGSGLASKWRWQWQPSVQNAMITISFLDGHTKSMQLRQYFTPKLTSQNQRVYQYLWPNE